VAVLALGLAAASAQTVTVDGPAPTVSFAIPDPRTLDVPAVPRDDWPFAPPPGWFVNLEMAAVTTHVDLGIYGPPPPTLNNLDWTVLPKAELGYRFESGEAVLFEYRYLGAVANAGTSVGEPLTEDHDTFLANQFTLDYQSRVYQPWCGTAFQWQAGVRIASLSYTMLDHWDGVEADRWRQSIVAAGPHVAIKPAVQIGDGGLTAFVFVDGSELVGRRTQDWQSTAVAGDGIGATITGGHDYALSAALEVGWEAGLNYTPPTCPWLRLSGGYQGECVFWVGRSFTQQGPFVRLGIGF
jgi:hypothetical protein